SSFAFSKYLYFCTKNVQNFYANLVGTLTLSNSKYSKKRKNHSLNHHKEQRMEGKRKVKYFYKNFLLNKF
ncbi:hypothetical protein Mgra_00002697, partial [Meloidogyne graminicola]